MGVLRHWECPKHGRSPAPFLTLEGVRLCGDPHCGLEAVEVEYVSASQLEGAVLRPEIAAVAATLVDLAKRSLPPHISEEQQVEAYLALRRIAGGQCETASAAPPRFEVDRKDEDR